VKKNQVKRVRDYRKYPEELKRKIGKSYLAGEASYGVLAEENGLKNKDVVKEFVKWYRRKLATEPNFDLEVPIEKNHSLDQSEDDNQSSELLELKKQLKQSQLKNEMLETMIDVAEKELNVDIRKKSGTNQ